MPDDRASIDGMKAAAIPGTPAGLAWLAQRYGRLSLALSLACVFWRKTAFRPMRATFV